MTLTGLLIIAICSSLSIGVSVGSAAGALSARKDAQQSCLERAELAGMYPIRAQQICGRSKRVRDAALARRDARRTRRAARM